MSYANKQESAFKRLETWHSYANDGAGTSTQVEGNMRQNEIIEAIAREIDKSDSYNQEQEVNLENIEDADYNNEEEVINYFLYFLEFYIL